MSFREELGKSPSSQAPAGSITDLRTSIHWISTSPARSSSHRHSSRSAPSSQVPRPSLLSPVLWVLLWIPPARAPTAATVCVQKTPPHGAPASPPQDVWLLHEPLSPSCLALIILLDPNTHSWKALASKGAVGPQEKKKSFGYRKALLRILPMMNDLKPK